MKIPVALLIAVLQLLSLSACSSWTVSTKPLTELTNPRPERLKIQLVSGQEMVLYEPTLAGDSIIGGLSRNWKPAGGAWTHEVVTVSTRKPSVLRSTIVVVAVTAAVVATLHSLKKALDADYASAPKVP